MDRIVYIILVFLGCIFFFKFLFPVLLFLIIGYLVYYFVKQLIMPAPKHEDYYEQTVHNPHQNSESDIIDVEAVVIDEE